MKTTLFALAGITLLGAALHFVAHSSPASAPLLGAVTDAHFLQLLRTAGIAVEGARDLQYRYGVYLANVRHIEASNARQPGYTLGVTAAALLTFPEFAAKMGLRTIGAGEPVAEVQEEGVRGPSVDWRGKYDVTPVKNQTYSCNAGYAMAVAGVIESSVKKYRGTVTPVSPQQLVDCSKPNGNFGCQGGYAGKALDYVKPNGIAAEGDYPYTAQEGACASKPAYAGIKGYANIADENKAMAALNSQPVVFGFEYNADLQHYTGGIYKNRTTCGGNLNHYGVGVGYVYTDSFTSYWIIKNSFGSGWGEAGYLRLDLYSCGVARNQFNQALLE